MGELARDVGYAARLYRKSPGFAILTTSLIALGIAANTILFSNVDAVFLRPLSVSHPEQLVRFVGTAPGSPGNVQYSYPFYDMICDRNQAFSDRLAGAVGTAANLWIRHPQIS